MDFDSQNEAHTAESSVAAYLSSMMLVSALSCFLNSFRMGAKGLWYHVNTATSDCMVVYMRRLVSNHSWQLVLELVVLKEDSIHSRHMSIEA